MAQLTDDCFAFSGPLLRLEDMERLAVEESRKIGLGALQLALDVQADAEVPLPGLRGTDGHWRGCREKSATTVVTMLGRVRVRRIAYRSRKKGVAGLHWRDAVLNLPPCGYSWQMQKFAEMACRSGSFREAGEMVHAATGNRTGNRQLEEITARAAADAGAFAQDRPVPDAPVITGPDGEERAAVLGMSADAKGVTMRPQALRAVRKAGRVICGGIHMSPIPQFPYEWLWGERQIVSVANLTRQDGIDFLKIAPRVGIRTRTTAFPLAEANDVLNKLRSGQILGAAVLKP